MTNARKIYGHILTAVGVVGGLALIVFGSVSETDQPVVLAGVALIVLAGINALLVARRGRGTDRL